MLRSCSLLFALLMGLAQAADPKPTDGKNDKPETLYNGQPASFWVQQLRDKNPDIQVASMNALAAIGPEGKAAIPQILSILKEDANTYAKFAADPSRDPFPPSRKALWAAGQKALAAVGRESIKQLADALSDEVVAVAVADALGTIGPPARPAVPALTDALNRKVWAESMVIALGAIGPGAAEALPILRQTAKNDPKGTVRAEAIRSVWRISGDYAEATELVKVLATNGFKDNLDSLVAGIIIEKLVAEMKERIAAENAAIEAERNKPGTVAYWIVRLRDASLETRIEAANALGQMGDKAKAALPALRETASAAEPRLREAVAAALTKVGGPEEERRRAEQEKAQRERQTADQERQIAVLLGKLKSSIPETRRRASVDLGKLGPIAKSATDALKSVAETDKNEFVRKAALGALKQIEGK